jgi:hypothetical protein
MRLTLYLQRLTPQGGPAPPAQQLSMWAAVLAPVGKALLLPACTALRLQQARKAITVQASRRVRAAPLESPQAMRDLSWPG